MPEQLRLALRTGALTYEPTVATGERVRFGDVVALARWPGGTAMGEPVLALPAPAGGRVTLEDDGSGSPVRLLLEVDETRVEPAGALLEKTGRDGDAQELRRRLVRGGVWQLFYESPTGGVPPVDAPPPKAIIVAAVKAEPFRARGDVILTRHRELFRAGLEFLEALLEGYGRIHLILTAEQTRLAQEIKEAVAGKAWVRPLFLPLFYPVENERLLAKALRYADVSLGSKDPVWVLDAQAVVAVGRCLGEGIPLIDRIVALGGPGCADPRHLTVRIGTPISALLGEAGGDALRVLRGGVFTGEVIDREEAAIEPSDDAFFLLPEPRSREFLGFMRPGPDRESYAPAFLSALFPRRPRTMYAGLRGERRACISCGFCEEVCPAGIMPHLIYRFLTVEEHASTGALTGSGTTLPGGPGAPGSSPGDSEAALEEAQLAGAELCVTCGLCSYVCPSKLELAQVIADGRERIRTELAAEAQP